MEGQVFKAVLEKNESLVQLLLRSGGSANDVYRPISNGQDTYLLGLSALHCAMGSKSLAITKILVEHGADVNKKNHKNGYTPLHRAVLFGDLELVKFLVSHGSLITSEELCAAMKNEEYEIAKFLILRGEPHILDNNPSEGGTALHIIVRSKNLKALELVELLLNNGADVNSTVSGFSPLCIATCCGNPNIALALIARGAQVNVKSLVEDYHLFMFQFSGNLSQNVGILSIWLYSLTFCCKKRFSVGRSITVETWRRPYSKK